MVDYDQRLRGIAGHQAAQGVSGSAGHIVLA
jgi:hypothetical protein